MSDASPGLVARRRWVRRGGLNIAWLAIALVQITIVNDLWPYPSWAWGLILGAGIGGAAAFIVAVLWTVVIDFGGFAS